MKRVIKTNVPVDDQPHRIPGGKVVAVGCQNGPEAVQVWTEDFDNGENSPRVVQVFGTGHWMPSAGEHLGTAAWGPLVWHVYQVQP